MDETPDRMARKPSWLITQLAVHAHRLAMGGFAATGARGYHYRVLGALHEFGPSSQADIGRRCRIDRSDVVAVVNQLVANGHVDRSPDPEHGRRNRVTLTPAGLEQLRRMDVVLDEVQDDLLRPLTPADRETFTRLLTEVLIHHEQD
ncbi:MarR family transcriptional regulator [Streptomyces sp. NPDC049881]|uniref:MarR family winged helix-turn-helix transcriptional regulator n=1 Tax=unclassified Streptomyces TaxID=2593676 RepID=UPI00341F088C